MPTNPGARRTNIFVFLQLAWTTSSKVSVARLATDSPLAIVGNFHDDLLTIREAEATLDQLAYEKYPQLTEAEIQTLVVDDFGPHNTSLWVTSFKGNDPKFVFYQYTRLGLERFATGSGVPTLNRNDVHAYQVLIPPSAIEQTAIAKVLSDMDAELAGLELRREKTRALKQGMIQELLTGRTRLVAPSGTTL